MIDVGKEKNIEILRHACGAYEKANRQLLAKIQDLTQELADLKGLDAAQIGLDLPDVHFTAPAPAAPDEPNAEARRPKAERKQRGHGPTAQETLPVEHKHHEIEKLPECEACGGTMECWEGQHEESDEVTVVESSYRIHVHLRQKYRCRCNASIVTAPGPPKLIPGGRYSVDFAVHSAVAKFCDHMPLERQVRAMGRQGLVITSQTLWDQQAALARHLKPTWEALCAEALQAPVLHVDETSWRMMGSKSRSKWTLFGLTTPSIAAYHLVGSKSAAMAREILRGYRGILVVDGFAVYPIVAALEKGIRIAHCWAHADRKFKEAKDPPARVAEIRGLIATLYEIEREVEGPFPGNEAACAKRQALRKERSEPILVAIRNWALDQGGLRRSSFGKAVRYMLKHWNGLAMFLDDPRVPLDNNAAERVLRGPVVGRKNFYGNRSERGAEVAAILYSVIETAKLNGSPPDTLLRATADLAINRPGAALLPVGENRYHTVR